MLLQVRQEILLKKRPYWGIMGQCLIKIPINHPLQSGLAKIDDPDKHISNKICRVTRFIPEEPEKNGD